MLVLTPSILAHRIIGTSSPMTVWLLASLILAKTLAQDTRQTPTSFTCTDRDGPSMPWHREILTANASRAIQIALADRGCCMLTTIHAPVRRDRTMRTVYHSWRCHERALPLSVPFVAKRSTAKTAATNSRPNEAVNVVHEKVQVFETQETTGWNLDRVDTRAAIYDNLYTPFGLPPTRNGPPAIHIYIVDTGIDPTHPAFQDMAVAMDYPSAAGARDCNGHGTHVASIVGGRTTGVMPERGHVVLHAIRVLDCAGSGTTTLVIQGLAWITENMPTDPETVVIVNLSLGGPKSTLLNDYVNTLYTEFGILSVTAAGNENTDACTRSPASAEYTISVGSTRLGDTRSSFSNHGTCVNMFAPGSEVMGADLDPARPYRPRSGTSMAAPHITGGLARFVIILTAQSLMTSEAEREGSKTLPTAPPFLHTPGDTTRSLSPGETIANQAWQLMVDRSTRGLIRNLHPGSFNRLLFLGTPRPPPPLYPPPTPHPAPPSEVGDGKTQQPPPPFLSPPLPPPRPPPPHNASANSTLEPVYHLIFLAVALLL